MRIKKAIMSLVLLLLVGASVCVIPVISTCKKKITYQRDAFLIDNFEADVEASVSKGETWYITIAVDSSKDVIDGAFEDAFKKLLKDFINQLNSNELMPDETKIWVNVSVFDGIIDGDLNKGTVHDISKGFFKVAGDKSDNYEMKTNCNKLKDAIDHISFEATSTFVEGAIWGSQQLMDRNVKDTSVHTMILLFTDGFNENIENDGGTGTQSELNKNGAKQEYEERGSDKIRKAEVIPIALNFRGNYSEETLNGRDNGRSNLQELAPKTRYGAGVFASEERGRENYREVKNLAELVSALWDVSDYISPKLEKINYEQDGFRFAAHGVKAVRLYMLKPETTNTNPSIKVSYNGQNIETRPFGLLCDEIDANQAFCYCETVQLESDNNAKLGNTIEITYADQSVVNVYAAFEGLKYEVDCLCRPRSEKDYIDENSFYVGEISLKPYLQGLVEDSRLKVEAYLSNSYFDTGSLDNRVYCLDASSEKNGSYEAHIPIPDSHEEMELRIVFYVEDEELGRIEQQTIFTKIRLNGKSSVNNFVEGRNVHEAEKTVDEGDSIAINLNTLLPGLHITGIKGESRSPLIFDIDEEKERIILKGMKKGENNDYLITGVDESNNLWTISGKINVREKEKVISILMPVLLSTFMILISFLVFRYVDLSNALEVTIKDAGGGESLKLRVSEVNRSKNSLYDLLNSQTYLSDIDQDIFKNVKVKKRLTGQFVIFDINKKKKIMLSKTDDIYPVKSDVELATLARIKVR